MLCATGEIGPNPRLYVWNSKTMEEVYSASAPMLKGIKHVAFSPNGKYLACTDMQDDHNVCVFDVKTKLKPGAVWTPVAYSMGSKAVVMSLGWNAASDVVITTCVKQVVFYSLMNGKLTAKNGSGWGV
jgi:WD40 repeat protein